jgi:nucleoside-diphosphate-sugar epimerase
MGRIIPHDFIVGQDDRILVTGATGFIGSRLVANLLERGFRNIRCFARPSSAAVWVDSLSASASAAGRVEVITGNLLSLEDCHAATKDVAVIFHLAAGRGEKSFPDAFMNSVVTTRNLLEASMQHQCLKRFVNVSSFTVYTNTKKPRWRMLDESCPVETQAELRGDAYGYAKLKQDEIVAEYGRKFGIPCVIVRPGVVYGSGNEAIHGRIGIGTFGFFLHLGGSNVMPFTYVDNCADAIALAGLHKGTDGEVFNIVDDDLPTSRQFLHLYKQQVRQFKSIYVPHILSYVLCYAWERYSAWSEGQLPPAFNRKRWNANWRKTHYSNAKLKGIGWIPKVPTAEGLMCYFKACRIGGRNA